MSKKSKDKGKITKNMTIEDLVSKYPDSVGVLMESGMGCVGCAIAGMETIEQGAQAHGIDVENLMKKLKKVCKDE